MEIIEESHLPEFLPVMVLQGATLFPHGLLPLFIFEQRYRDMLAYAIEHDRMFCVGNVRSGVDPETDPNPVHRITTAGLVRACVKHEDGTSHLMLSGIRRIQLLEWTQSGPFRIARVSPVPCLVEDMEDARAAAADAIDLCGRLDENGKKISGMLEQHLRELNDPSTIADVIAQNFVIDPCERQELINTVEVGQRLERLSFCLNALIGEK